MKYKEILLSMCVIYVLFKNGFIYPVNKQGQSSSVGKIFLEN
jgi:hypothetical protein